MTLPSPFSKQALREAVCYRDLIVLRLSEISGDQEAVNELLDVINEKVHDSTLKQISFNSWRSTVTEIESELLTLFASKCINLETLGVRDMTETGNQVRKSLFMMVLDILKFQPEKLKALSLARAGFDELAGKELCEELNRESVT